MLFQNAVSIAIDMLEIAVNTKFHKRLQCVISRISFFDEQQKYDRDMASIFFWITLALLGFGGVMQTLQFLVFTCR